MTVIKSALGGVALVLAAAFAIPAPAGTLTPSTARSFVENITNDALAQLRGRLPLAVLKARVRALIAQDFDMAYLARSFAGPYWAAASERDRSEFETLLGAYFVDVHAKYLKDFSSEKIVVTGARLEGGEAVVSSRLETGDPTDPAVGLEWVVHESASGPRLIDIRVDGISLAQTHRDTMLSVLRRRGGLAGLNDALRTKLAALE